MTMRNVGSPKGLRYVLLAMVFAAQAGSLAQAPSEVTITLVRWPFT